MFIVWLLLSAHTDKNSPKILSLSNACIVCDDKETIEIRNLLKITKI